jgi:hypothetical protein
MLYRQKTDRKYIRVMKCDNGGNGAEYLLPVFFAALFAATSSKKFI